MTESTWYAKVGCLTADIAGLAQGHHRASRNRSLLSLLEQDRDAAGLRRKRIQRRPKHGFLSVPHAERSELPDDIEFFERPSRVLSAPDRGDRLGQISDEVHLVPRAIPGLRHRHGELAARRLDADGNGIEGLADGREDAALVGSHEAAAPIDYHLRSKRGGQPESLDVAALTLGRRRDGKLIAPSNAVPVVDVEGEGDYIRGLRQLSQQGVGWWARAAALRGKEFHHRRPARAARLRLELRAQAGANADTYQGHDGHTFRQACHGVIPHGSGFFECFPVHHRKSRGPSDAPMAVGISIPSRYHTPINGAASSGQCRE